VPDEDFITRVVNHNRKLVRVQKFCDHKRRCRGFPAFRFSPAAISQSFTRMSSCPRNSAVGVLCNRFDALRVLYRQRSDRRYSVASVRGKSLKVRNCACTAAGIESGNGQQDWRRRCCVSVRCSSLVRLPCLRFTTTYCDENCRSRSTSGWNVPAIANVRVEFSERKENLKRLNKIAAAMDLRDFYTSLFRTHHGNKPRTSVASATRPTARIIAPARGGT